MSSIDDGVLERLRRAPQPCENDEVAPAVIDPLKKTWWVDLFLGTSGSQTRCGMRSLREARRGAAGKHFAAALLALPANTAIFPLRAFARLIEQAERPDLTTRSSYDLARQRTDIGLQEDATARRVLALGRQLADMCGYATQQGLIEGALTYAGLLEDAAAADAELDAFVSRLDECPMPRVRTSYHVQKALAKTRAEIDAFREFLRSWHAEQRLLAPLMPGGVQPDLPDAAFNPPIASGPMTVNADEAAAVSNFDGATCFCVGGRGSVYVRGTPRRATSMHLDLSWRLDRKGRARPPVPCFSPPFTVHGLEMRLGLRCEDEHSADRLTVDLHLLRISDAVLPPRMFTAVYDRSNKARVHPCHHLHVTGTCNAEAFDSWRTVPRSMRLGKLVSSLAPVAVSLLRGSNIRLKQPAPGAALWTAAGLQVDVRARLDGIGCVAADVTDVADVPDVPAHGMGRMSVLPDEVLECASNQAGGPHD